MEVGQTVIVVARDAGLRRSFVFALQAEGYRVEAHAALSSAVAPVRSAAAVCALIDESALRGVENGADLVVRLGVPVISLVSGFGRPDPLGELAGEVLTKPLQGTQLADAIVRVRGKTRPAGAK